MGKWKMSHCIATVVCSVFLLAVATERAQTVTDNATLVG